MDGGNPGTPLDGNDQHCSATDQRGTTRPIDGDNSNGARCDIGAFEAPLAQVQTLTVEKRGFGNSGGTVTSSGGGIDCGTDCQHRYPHNAVVTLTATPDPGFVWGCFCGIGLALRRTDEGSSHMQPNSPAPDPEM